MTTPSVVKVIQVNSEARHNLRNTCRNWLLGDSKGLASDNVLQFATQGTEGWFPVIRKKGIRMLKGHREWTSETQLNRPRFFVKHITD